MPVSANGSKGCAAGRRSLDRPLVDIRSAGSKGTRPTPRHPRARGSKRTRPAPPDVVPALAGTYKRLKQRDAQHLECVEAGVTHHRHQHAASPDIHDRPEGSQYPSDNSRVVPLLQMAKSEGDAEHDHACRRATKVALE